MYKYKAQVYKYFEWFFITVPLHEQVHKTENENSQRVVHKNMFVGPFKQSAAAASKIQQSIKGHI